MNKSKSVLDGIEPTKEHKFSAYCVVGSIITAVVLIAIAVWVS